MFGNWPTVYEGLSSLPEKVQESWFGFDHFYSDNSFKQALEVVFASPVRTLLDVDGNTGRWATQCVACSPEVEVTIMDLPQQLEMMREQTKGLEGADRIHGLAANLLDEETRFPEPSMPSWMSQFLDCFSEEEAVSILTRAAASMSPASKLYIMETFWAPAEIRNRIVLLGANLGLLHRLGQRQQQDVPLGRHGALRGGRRTDGRGAIRRTGIRPQHHAVPGPITHIPQ